MPALSSGFRSFRGQTLADQRLAYRRGGEFVRRFGFRDCILTSSVDAANSTLGVRPRSDPPLIRQSRSDRRGGSWSMRFLSSRGRGRIEFFERGVRLKCRCHRLRLVEEYLVVLPTTRLESAGGRCLAGRPGAATRPVVCRADRDRRLPAGLDQRELPSLREAELACASRIIPATAPATVDPQVAGRGTKGRQLSAAEVDKVRGELANYRRFAEVPSRSWR